MSTIVAIMCDHVGADGLNDCGEWSTPYQTATLARREAKRTEGWSRLPDGRDLCATHTKEVSRGRV